jgi:hypothetical protein
MSEFSTTQDNMRLVGVVQVRVGGRLYALPVSAMEFASDQNDSSVADKRGGFFVQGDTMGIVVDETASEQQMREQVMDGCAEAVRHLSAKILN